MCDYDTYIVTRVTQTLNPSNPRKISQGYAGKHRSASVACILSYIFRVKVALPSHYGLRAVPFVFNGQSDEVRKDMKALVEEARKIARITAGGGAVAGAIAGGVPEPANPPRAQAQATALEMVAWIHPNTCFT